jgi:hypothetical protein
MLSTELLMLLPSPAVNRCLLHRNRVSAAQPRLGRAEHVDVDA